MRYKQFKILKYKSISKMIIININRNKLLPIIGENECGKTTILRSIFAFDYSNDNMLNGEHINNIHNQYNPADNQPSQISAIIEFDDDDKLSYVEIIKEHHKQTALSENTYEAVIKTQPNELNITRYFNGGRFYKIEDPIWKDENKEVQDAICKEIINRLPHIIYFDDFLESIPDEIIITEEDKTSWQETMDLLLKSVDPQYSTTTLKEKEENAIDSIQSDVSEKLTNTITEKWTQMRLEEVDNFKIKFIYDKTKPSIKLKVIEKVKDNKNDEVLKDKERTFDIRQRSKGFFWFFNFVIKSEFNPKMKSKEIIFLLDEPGAYLHISMQEKLCEKLAKLSETSTVIYCTHSHNLLNPKHIDISNIHICYKEQEQNGNIVMQNIGDYANNSKVERTRKSLAFEPIYHVLGISHILIGSVWKKTQKC
jgi:predicted ATP-dependent endonuclease of OLD family